MLEIGGRKVGWGYPPVISAELGLNHGADLDRALEMIDKAAEVGVDGVKIQYYRTEDFCTDREKEFTYKQRSLGPENGIQPSLEKVIEKEYDFFKRHEIDLAFVDRCYSRAKAHDLIFGVTTTSAEGVARVLDMADYWKVASDMIGRPKMIQTMIDTELPIIVSLGHLSLEDLPSWMTSFEARRYLYLHCVSAYPAKNPKLWKLIHLQSFCDLVGYSHHSKGIEACVRAAELGAVWIEAHFTLDHTLPGSDHFWSLDPQEMKRLVGAIK